MTKMCMNSEERYYRVNGSNTQTKVSSSGTQTQKLMLGGDDSEGEQDIEDFQE